MDYVFEINDKSGRKIHLSRERWSHITIKHSDMADKLNEIMETLTKPLLIEPHKLDDNIRNYYREF